MSHKYDLAIIGGGIVGVSILYQALKKFPNFKIALFDRSLVGSGASFYSAGLSIPLATNEIVRDVIKNNDPEQFNNQYSKCRHKIETFYIVSKSSLSAFLKCYAGDDIPQSIDKIGMNKIRKYFSDFKLNDDKIILVSYKNHYADTYSIIQNVVSDTRSTGKADIYESTEIIAIDDSQKYIVLQGLTTAFLAKKVFIATGPWHKFETSSKTQNKKIVAFHLKDIRLDQKAPVVFFYDEDAFLLPLHEKGHWLLSYTCQKWNVAPSLDLSIEPDELSEAQCLMRPFIPISINKISGGRVFCDAYTKNKEPIVEYLNSSRKSVIICSGMSGSGYRLASGVANMALLKLSEHSRG